MNPGNTLPWNSPRSVRFVFPDAEEPRKIMDKTHEPIIVVSGLPRSGTSMTMKMLAAGGVPILTDQVRPADEDNPEGYFELERVKRLGVYSGWLCDAPGKAIKVVSFHLAELPPAYDYKILFVRRALPEVLASQRQMLLRNGKSAPPEGDPAMAAAYEEHLRKTYAWLARQHHLQVLFLDHHATVEQPFVAAEAIQTFLEQNLDCAAMAAAVNPTLYRQRCR